MNREILFRGKRKDNGEWVYGDVLRSDEQRFIVPIMGISCVEEYEHADTNKFIQLYAYEVIPETVCQYTGLADKNGRRYEGDIFQASDGDYIQRYIIAWNEDSLEWSADCITDPEGTLPLSEFKVSEIKVIGNIFDNPELLKE